MNNLTGSLLLYSNLNEKELLYGMAEACRLEEDEDFCSLAERSMNQQLLALLRLAQEQGFTGNIWHQYLTWFMVRHETPFSRTAEGRRLPPHALQTAARMDFSILRRLFFWPFPMSVQMLLDWPGASETPLAQLRDRLAAAPDDEAFYQEMLAWFYGYGCGELGLYQAFRVRRRDRAPELVPVRHPDPVRLEDLIGYDLQKNRLRTNVEAFLNGKPFNNMLLYGDAGTGKSTSIRSLVNEYGEKGLRLVELTAEDFSCIPDLVALLRERQYHFILFIDDLSYDEGDSGYRFLKAAMEGGLETRPDNVMLCATSNRRHLVRESWKDRSDMEHDDDVHRSDTIEEKLSLAGRFGCLIQFYAGDRKLFERIVLALAERQTELHLSREELLAAANRWEIRHGGVTGRTAQQFINALASGEAK